MHGEILKEPFSEKAGLTDQKKLLSFALATSLCLFDFMI